LTDWLASDRRATPQTSIVLAHPDLAACVPPTSARTLRQDTRRIGALALDRVERGVRVHLAVHPEIDLPVRCAFREGEETGWFEHGSTIIAFTHPDLALRDNVREGAICLGERLARVSTAVARFRPRCP
jgi:hypothetical protein